MPKYYIWTIGCQMNKAESERLSAYLETRGFEPSAAADDADFILLNSCVVRQNAENKVIHKLDAMKVLKKNNPELVLALTGCLVDSDISQLKASFPHVDHFFQPGEYPLLGKCTPSHSLPTHPSPCTYVPIIQGCNNFCTYCIVPYRRGQEKSRTPDDIIGEVRALVERGVKEVTLLGQNVDSYGHDLPGKPDLAELLTKLNEIDGLARIRFLTNHPKDMSIRLIEAIASLVKVCEQINLPVQSGDNDILKAMGRGYTVEHYRRLIARIREVVPDIALGTDVIVGFPSESDAQFQNTFNLLGEIKFDSVHVAAYSPRPGTYAAKELKDNVPPSDKRARLDRIERLQETISAGINSQLLGQTVEVLVEGKEKGKWRGRTRTDKLVFFSSNDNFLSKLVQIEIDRTSPWSLQGKIG